ncbi:MAG: hypothetical protein ABIP85_07630 [Chthoniobacteraceae bacterium]
MRGDAGGIPKIPVVEWTERMNTTGNCMEKTSAKDGAAEQWNARSGAHFVLDGHPVGLASLDHRLAAMPPVSKSV